MHNDEWMFNEPDTSTHHPFLVWFIVHRIHYLLYSIQEMDLMHVWDPLIVYILHSLELCDRQTMTHGSDPWSTLL